MARTKLGPIVSDISGSVGNQTFYNWRAGVSCVKAKATVVTNPNSAFQQTIRNAVTSASQRWFSTLTQAQRNAWKEFAQEQLRMEGRLGGMESFIPRNRGRMSGYNAYIMVNLRRRSIYITAALDDPPIGATPPSTATNLHAVWASPTLTVTWTDPTKKDAGAYNRIWLRNREQTVHRQRRSGVAMGVQTVGYTTVRSLGGAVVALTTVPGHYLIAIDVVNPNGTKSMPSETIDIIIT